MPVNDNDPPGSGTVLPDPHGHAALLLVESLIHALISRSVLSIEAALDVVDSASSVQLDLVDVAVGTGNQMQQSLALLAAIADSLKIDSAPRL